MSQAAIDASAETTELQRLQHLVAQLTHTAAHDPLTGLPTRVMLLERLAEELARDASTPGHIAILFVDLDNFKLVNDSLGHGSGDEVLHEMARRVIGCIGADDLASRFGGDEMVILHAFATAESATALGERILAVFAEPIFLSGKEVVVSASIGLALSRRGEKTVEQLLREADTALYAAKAHGRARLEYFNDELLARAQRRVQIESDLRTALRRSELFLEYQPQVRLKDGLIVGLEALVRWRHPTQGIIPPVEFIAIAEDCGLIGKIGETVLREACRQLAEWNPQSPCRGLAMTVNISPREIAEPGFLPNLHQILTDTAIDPAALCLEITESAMVGAAAETIRVLDQIRQIGVFIAIDDFGIEHSSLSRLRDLPAEVLKIDRSFVDGLSSEPGDTAIVSSILSLAFAMGKHTIAEGVETREQAAMLLRMGCDVAQGFFFSRPVAAAQIAPLLGRPLWRPPSRLTLRAAQPVQQSLRQAHRYFIDEFLDQIGAPMGTKLGNAP